MSEIQHLCEAILNHLTALGRKTSHSMLPGLSQTQIAQLTSGLPIVLPQSVVELYQWSEGLHPASGLGNEFFPGFGMESLTQMVATYKDLGNSDDYPRFHSGDQRWFPIFQSGGTDFYGVSCFEYPTEDGTVIDDDNEGEHRDCVTHPRVAFVSLEAMLETLLSAYTSGVYYVDATGRLTVGVKTYFDDGAYKGQLKSVDLSEFNAIAREFNPGLNY